MKQKLLLIFTMTCLTFGACNQQDNKPYTAPLVQKKRVIEEPFKYHKTIEVAPGQYYDVLSWGRGAAGGGAYIILQSDSTDQKYNSTTGDLEGPIQDVLNADLDTDGNPEIIIQAKSIDTSKFISIFVYEYHNFNANKLDFPRLTAPQRRGYRGNDNFFLKDSKLMREFPIYKGTGTAAKPSGQKRLLEYSLHSNSFSVNQISKDSTLDVSIKPVAITLEKSKKEGHSKSDETKSSAKHHREHKVAKKHKSHKSKTKKKKRNHRRR